jgi:hypothetical protein
MQTKDETYNGWTNYATWGVKLVLDNDEGTYNHVRTTVEAIRKQAPEASSVRDGIWDEDQFVKYTTADFLKDLTEELCDVPDCHTKWSEGTRSALMARQVIQAGLAEVNWEEIAANVLSET